MTDVNIIFPPSILAYAEGKKLGAYPISLSILAVAGPSNSLVYGEFNFVTEQKLIAIYYDALILNTAAIARKPTAVRLELNTNPIQSISVIGQSGFTPLSGSSLVQSFLRYNLPNELSYIITETHPMLIPGGIPFRPTVTIYDPAFLITDTINFQSTLIFSEA